MRTKLSAFLMVILVLSGVRVFALEGQRAEYVAGTVKALKLGAMGDLDTTAIPVLEFHSGAGQFSIPYAQVSFYECREEAKFHLWVIPAIAVGLLKKRAKVHFVTIIWKGEDNIPLAKTDPKLVR